MFVLPCNGEEGDGDDDDDGDDDADAGDGQQGKRLFGPTLDSH